MCWILPHVDNRHLMRTPRTFRLMTVDFSRACPTLRRAQHDHWPAWTLDGSRCARCVLDFLDLCDHCIECRRHRLMHLVGIRAFDEIRRIAIADEQRFELFVTDARKNRRVSDLVAVEIQDRQYRAITRRID